MKKYFKDNVETTRAPRLTKLKTDSTKDAPEELKPGVEEDDDCDWDTMQPASMSKKFDHKWIEETKGLAKWQEKKNQIETMILFIKTSGKIETKDLFEISSFLKLMLNEGIAVLNTAAMNVASVMCRAARKGLKTICKSELLGIILTKMRDKKMATEAMKHVIEFVKWSISMDDLFDEVSKSLNDKKVNLVQKIETCNMIDSFTQSAFMKPRKDELKKFCLDFGNGFIVKYLNDSDPKVKDASSKLITSIMNIYGLKPFEHLLKDVNATRIKQIKDTLKPVQDDIEEQDNNKNKSKNSKSDNKSPINENVLRKV